MDKGKGQILVANDEGFIEMKQKKLGGNFRGNKPFKSISVKQKTQYRPKVKQSNAGTCNSSKMAPPVGMNKASTSGYNKNSLSNNGNGFSISNSFEAFDVEVMKTSQEALQSPRHVLKGSRRTKAQRAYGALKRGADQDAGFMNMSHIKLKVVILSVSSMNEPKSRVFPPNSIQTGIKVTTTRMQEEGKCFVPLVERINVLEKHILEGKLVLVDDNGKPLEKVDYLDNSGSNDEVEPVENETAIFLASKGVGYGLKSLWEQ
ncbi:hypothetical protein Tco_1291663 [Tanacetum coccineum]